MIRAASLALVTLVALTGCARGGEAGPETRWRVVASAADRDRLRDWRTVWVAALAQARVADAGAVTAQGPLFAPDTALANAMPPAGDYRCRGFRLGGQRPDVPRFAALPPVPCRIGRDDDMPVLTVTAGVQRPTGHLYADSDTRAVFLGTLQLGDETTSLRYGQDARRNSVGYVERVAPGRWRLVLPMPGFDSQLDVIELVPAG